MFQVGDIVEYHSEILLNQRWIGIVVDISQIGGIPHSKIKFFNEGTHSPARAMLNERLTKVS